MIFLLPRRNKVTTSPFEWNILASSWDTIPIVSINERNLNKYSSWRRLSSHIGAGIMEGSCVTHAGYIWTLSGYDCINQRNLKKINSTFTNVHLYDYKLNQWYPGPSLNSTLHHAFSSAFSVGHRIITIGGLRETFDDNSHRTEANPLVFELDTTQMNLTSNSIKSMTTNWRPAILSESLEQIVKELEPGGITTCTQIPTLDGKYYCYIDSGGTYVQKMPRFISIKFKNTSDALNAKWNESVIDSIEKLSIIPEFRHSHTNLLVDLYRNEILMISGRYSKTKKPHRECHSYLISTNRWVRLYRLQLPNSMSPYEARGFIQLDYNIKDDFSLSWLLGGQDIYNNVVTHEIWALKLFRNPSLNSDRRFSYFDIYQLDLLPQHLMGPCVLKLPNQNQNPRSSNRNLLIFGGSLNVGPYGSSSVYEWIPPSNKVLSRLSPDISMKPNCSQIEFYTIESARFGLYDVTEEMRTLLVSGTITYPDYIFNVTNCHHFQLKPQASDHNCNNELSITMFDQRLNRRYTTTCVYANSCRLIYC